MNHKTLQELEARRLEVQADSERRLAEKQTNPQLKRMIINSAIGKEEAAYEARTGRPIDPESSKYEKRLEQSLPQKAVVSTRR